MLDGTLERIARIDQPTGYGIGVARGRTDERAKVIAMVETFMPVAPHVNY